MQIQVLVDLYNEWRQAVEEYRREIDADPNA
jgi:hypothetical protein